MILKKRVYDPAISKWRWHTYRTGNREEILLKLKQGYSIFEGNKKSNISTRDLIKKLRREV